MGDVGSSDVGRRERRFDFSRDRKIDRVKTLKATAKHLPICREGTSNVRDIGGESGLEASRSGRAGYATALGLVDPAKSADRTQDLCRVSAGTGFYSRMMRRWNSLVIHCYSLFPGRMRVGKSSKHAGFRSISTSHFENSLFYWLLPVNLLEATKHVAEGGRIHVSWKPAASS